MRYVWKVVVEHPRTNEEKIEIYGTAANINVAISRAKKKVKENLNMKSDNSDLMILDVEMLHAIEF